MWKFEEMAGLFADMERSRLLRKGTWGLEKESQRVTVTGDLAMTDHPFGDKMSNPDITTDFAESQLEMITPALPSIEEAYAYLHRIHDEIESGIGDELLWPLSMPPRLPAEEQIRIAEFNGTPEGRAKESYRQRLAERYGKKMQMISGLHYNFSFHEDLFHFLAGRLGYEADKRALTDNLYFAMARNLLRYRWLLIYLFGASPSADSTYDSVIARELAIIDRCCPACCGKVGDYERYATSLRVSRFGYSSATQRKHTVSFNGLNEYIGDFKRLLTQGVLQKESEFYSSVRIKQLVRRDQSQLDALERKGVGYVELRIMDLNPYERAGISLQQLRFLHVFMLYCLFEQSPPITKREWRLIQDNHHIVSLFGRKPNLHLHLYQGGKVMLSEWIEEMMGKMSRIAELLDQHGGGAVFQAAVNQERAKGRNVRLLLSSLIRQEMQVNDETLLDFGIRQALRHKQRYLAVRV
ncbi:hypothetical protein AB6A23_26295 [Paenibacillus tarimensis]